jgi:hypothetical protein
MDARTAFMQSPEGETREVGERDLIPLMAKGWTQIPPPAAPAAEEHHG